MLICLSEFGVKTKQAIEVRDKHIFALDVGYLILNKC